MPNITIVFLGLMDGDEMVVMVCGLYLLFMNLIKMILNDFHMSGMRLDTDEEEMELYIFLFQSPITTSKAHQF